MEKILKYVIYAAIGVLAYYAYSFIDLEIRQRKQKARFAPAYPGGLFGFSFIKEMTALATSFKDYEYFRDRVLKYSPTHGSWILGSYVMVTTDPENIKAMLATQFSDFSGKGSIFKARWGRFLGQGIFNADGETWSHARVLMRPQFVKERVSTTENFEEKIQSVFKLIKPGEVTDVMDIWFRFTLDAATEHLIGHCSNSLAAGKEEEFATVFAKVQRLQASIDKRGPAWKLPFWKKEDKEFEEAMLALDAYIGRYVDLALTEEPDEKDESLLAELVRVDRDPVFLRDALVSALLAGRDTTAGTLSWLVQELSKEPSLYQDLRQEIIDTIGTSARPTYAQLKSLKLLQATINETLRLYPTVAFNIRASDRDTTLPRGGGADGMSPVFVPAGTGVVYSTLLMQRMQDIPDADKWMPRRWIDSDGEKYSPVPWTYIPFNGGPRICLGQNFALTEMAYAMTRVIQKFTALENCDEPLPPNDLGQRYDVILTPRFGVKARFIE